ncbi:N-acetylglucosamine-6-phosphate deacetylase [Bacillus carboniphilus]|uniref:N-acetylglucosamine-6-phosphate deacetylase n=1 Tax=Bacillus carboniphilus TaxID=86663 RepID=A0ABY9JUF1_9BACI|nr:N-acetylglucosamine-6-phosphate deacetylase [Bacillus carboniphilus]WLR43041.1 N-acetylglucosamine-6-phosphate deacetylase [Bacillus carboniphilus]
MILTGAPLYCEKEIVNRGIVIKNGIIQSFADPNIQLCEQNHFVFPSNFKIIPGRIDLHLHGAGGADAMDGTHKSLSKMAKQLVKEGTTSFLPTTMTTSNKEIERALESVGTYTSHPDEAEIIGIHLEGPFINERRAGAQPKHHIQAPSIIQFSKWQKLAKGKIKVVTVAPEGENATPFIKFLANNNVIPSLGHSNATFSEFIEGYTSGAKQATHLFNGMRPFHHREPGIVGGCLSSEGIMVELIADGIHLHPETIQFVYQVKGPGEHFTSHRFHYGKRLRQ